jgi:hypothetical protein
VAGNVVGTVALWEAATGKRLRTLMPSELRGRSEAALATLARGPAAEAGTPDPDRVRKRTGAVLELLRSEDPIVVRDAFAELKQLPLVRSPEGMDRLAALRMYPGEAEALKRLIDGRREIPGLLVSLAAGGPPRTRQGLEGSGYEKLAYEIVEGEAPTGDDAFTPAGAIRVSDRTLARIVVGFEWAKAIPVLRNSGTKTTPAAIRALLAVGEAGRYRAAHACLKAGWADGVPLVYELLDKDPAPPLEAALLDTLVRADPERALSAISRWSASPANDARRDLVRDTAFRCAGRKEIQVQLLQSPDQSLALEVAQSIAGGADLKELAEFRRLHREGKISDVTAGALLAGHAAAEDFPLLRELARSDQRSSALRAALALIRIGGEAEVESALAAMRHDPSYVSGPAAPLISERQRPALEKLLEAPEPKDKRMIRLLLAKAGRTDTLGDALDRPPMGTMDALTLAAVAGSLKDEALLKKVLVMAENWKDRTSHEAIWTSLLRSPLALSDTQLGAIARTATTPELRSLVASRLQRNWTKENLESLRPLLQRATGRDAEDLLSSLEPLPSLEAARAVLDSVPALLRARVSSERIARILAAPAERDELAPGLLALHQDSIRGMTLLNPVNLVLASARGTRHAELQALLRTYFGSTSAKFGGPKERPISQSSRMIAAESLAESKPEVAEDAATAARLLQSSRAEDRVVGSYYQWCRGRRLSPVEWGLLPQGEAGLYLGIAMRIPNATADAWEGWRRSALEYHNPEESRRFQTALSLLTSREFDIPIMLGTPELTLRQENGLRSAREWFVAHWNKSFEETFLEALSEAGYKVGSKPDLADAGELVRALRDSHWYLARNAAWMLGLLAKDGPRVREAFLLGQSEFRNPSQAPDLREIEAWEKWQRERRH